MKYDLRKKLYLCFAWEDLTEVNSIVADFRHELTADIDVFQCEENDDNLEDKVFPKIEEAEVVVVFISEASKNSQFVKDCVTHAVQLNKRMLPIELSKSFFSTLPAEFKFRTKPVSYKSEEQRAKLFSQLKASFGISVETGDSYGTLVHVTTDMDAVVSRYGEVLCNAKVNSDNTIRLTKGTHKLDFVASEYPEVTYSLSYEVKNNEGEQFVDVPLSKRLQEIIEALEKEDREKEARKQFELEQFQKNLALEQKQKELELQRQQALLAEQQKNEEKKNDIGCWTIGIVVVLGISMPISLFFTIPYLIYKRNK